MRGKDQAQRRPRHGQHGRAAKQSEWSGPASDRATAPGMRIDIRLDLASAAKGQTFGRLPRSTSVVRLAMRFK